MRAAPTTEQRAGRAVPGHGVRERGRAECVHERLFFGTCTDMSRVLSTVSNTGIVTVLKIRTHTYAVYGLGVKEQISFFITFGKKGFFKILRQKYAVNIMYGNLLINSYILATIGTLVSLFKQKKGILNLNIYSHTKKDVRGTCALGVIITGVSKAALHNLIIF